ncbi:hypothetical protein [Streptomyces sp. OE57]|uniref:hypothetical protein n=1 Tax=Streptomyces lacaronensis TaxID=3379885 RepID=UPI0039B77013
MSPAPAHRARRRTALMAPAVSTAAMATVTVGPPGNGGYGVRSYDVGYAYRPASPWTRRAKSWTSHPGRRWRGGGRSTWTSANGISGRDFTAYINGWLYDEKTPPMPGHPDWVAPEPPKSS